MNQLEDSLVVEKIESLFEDDINFFYNTKKNIQKKNLLSRIKVEHIYLIPSLIFKRTYRIMPDILKDLLFGLSVIHKSPSSKLVSKTKYDQIRTLVDIKVSSLTLKSFPKELQDEIKNTFTSGFYSLSLPDLSEIDELIDSVIHYSNPSHAGARPYFKDGKNKKIKGSFSAYYTFSRKDNQKINKIIRKVLTKDFNYHLSALAGYRCKLEDMFYSLSIVYGENSNSEMHQDSFASVAKGFIYLQDVGEGNSPFEYLKGSYIDATFRSKQTNKAVLDGDSFSSGSTRLRDNILEKAINKYELKSFTGSKGLFVVANTAGYHRKGSHNSIKPRIILACGVKRKGILIKLFINLFSIIKYKMRFFYSS